MAADPAGYVMPSTHPLLTGSFGPIDDESQFADMPVIGEVPRDLNGVYVRNGPNAHFQPQGRYHWFDGDGMLHAVYFHDGKVRYRNRYVRTRGLVEEQAAGRSIWPGVMDPPLKTPGRSPLKNTSNTDVIYYNGKLLTTWYQGAEPYQVDLATLQTLGAADFSGTLKTGMSAHARADEETGELLYFDYGRAWPYMSYGVVGADGKVKHAIPVELPGPSLPHDMAMTRNYAVLHDLSLSYDADALRAGRHKLRYYSQRPARFAVLPRYGATDEIRWFEAQPCFLYHVVNAWEERDAVVMVGCRFRTPRDRSGAPDEAAFAHMIANLQMDACLYEWRFNLVTGATHERLIDDTLNSEFPVISTALQGRPNRYSYQLVRKNRELGVPYFAGLAKYDIRDGSFTAHSDGEHCWYNEPGFAPADDPGAEDDGYLVSIVTDRREVLSEIHIYDARGRNLGLGPIARVRLPRVAPNGFHATWVSAARIARGR